MILELNGDYCLLNGKRTDDLQETYLTPYNNHEYRPSSSAPNLTDGKQYIHINTDTITITTSWFSEYPLFYYTKNALFILSSSFEALLRKLKEHRLDKLDLDRVALLESMILDNPLRSRTLFKEIKRVLPGTRLTVKTTPLAISQQTCFVLPFDKGSSDSNGSDLLDKAVMVIEELSRYLPEQDRQLLLPLSGGLDSRLLACLLTKHHIDYDTITFGPVESTEPYIAKKVARQLGIKNTHLILKNDYYKEYGEEVTRITGGLSSHMHCHLYAVLSANHLYDNTILHGYLGGEYAGANQPEHARNYSMNRSEALQAYTTQYLQPMRLWGELTAEDQDSVMGDLKKVMDENCSINLPCHFEEYLHNVDRQSALIANVFQPIERFGRVIRPFASKDYATFFNSLPYQLRVNRKLYIDACSLLFPDAFKIGTQNQIYRKNSLPGITERFLSLAIRKASLISLILSKGNFVIYNPKAFERHRVLIHTTLNADFNHALSVVSDLLNIDLRWLGFNNLKNKTQTITQYRVLSLDTLLKDLEQKGIQPDIH